MKIDNNLLNNKTLLALTVNAAVVDAIRNNNKQISGDKILQAAYDSVGMTELMFATNREKEIVANATKKCLGILEGVGAISSKAITKEGLLNYIRQKNGLTLLKASPFGIDATYSVAPDFIKKVKAVKSNEVVLRSKIIEVDFMDKKFDIVSVKNLEFETLKYCNKMYDYTNLGEYLACYNTKTQKVDLIATADKTVRFFNYADDYRVLPEEKQIKKLYYLVNMSKYKDMFVPVKSVANNSALKLRKAEAVDVTTEYINYKKVYPTKLYDKKSKLQDIIKTEYINSSVQSNVEF